MIAECGCNYIYGEMFGGHRKPLLDTDNLCCEGRQLWNAVGEANRQDDGTDVATDRMLDANIAYRAHESAVAEIIASGDPG